MQESGPEGPGRWSPSDDRVLFIFCRLVAKGFLNLILFDPGSRIACLTEILLFGAVAHHAGMGYPGFVLGMLGCRLAGHGGSPDGSNVPDQNRMRAILVPAIIAISSGKAGRRAIACSGLRAS
jgi:hypothetical protein